MRFRVLGAVEAWDGERAIDLRGSKPRTFLAALLLSRGGVVPDTALLDVLWGENPPATAGAQIQTYASRLRLALAGAAVVERRPPGYRLRVDPLELDLERFTELAAQGRQALAGGRFDEAAKTLGRALSLWQGPALGGVTPFFADLEQPQLEEARLSALEDRVEADLALGGHPGLTGEIVGLVRRHPLRERLWAQLITGLHRGGRRAGALAAYRDCRQVLAEELGVEPGRRLRALHQTILQGDPEQPALVPGPAALSWATGPAARTAAPAPVPFLAAEPADFTGRTAEAELAQLALHTGDAPICAVLGMGGVGKTTLALHVARRLRTDFPDGQLQVDLGASRDRPRTTREALAEALATDVPPDASEPTLIRLYHQRIDGRRLLVLLDDATDEQQVRPLLPRSAGSALLVTSRSPLATLEGAQRVPLGALNSQDATELLARLAGRARVAAEPEAARRLLRVCGNLPLAVRICGGRLATRRHWTLAKLADRLLDDNLLLNEFSLADLDVRSSLEASYRRLGPQARQALRLLVLLPLPGLSAWTAAVLLDLHLAAAQDLVEELAEAHLIDVVGTDPDRYRFHPLVRAFGWEKVRTEEPARIRARALERLSDAFVESPPAQAVVA